MVTHFGKCPCSPYHLFPPRKSNKQHLLGLILLSSSLIYASHPQRAGEVLSSHLICNLSSCRMRRRMPSPSCPASSTILHISGLLSLSLPATPIATCSWHPFPKLWCPHSALGTSFFQFYSYFDNQNNYSRVHIEQRISWKY